MAYRWSTAVLRESTGEALTAVLVTAAGIAEGTQPTFAFPDLGQNEDGRYWRGVTCTDMADAQAGWVQVKAPNGRVITAVLVLPLETGGGLSAAGLSAIWTYTTRTLTRPAHPGSGDDESEILIYNGVTNEITITDLGSLVGWEELWFTVKKRDSMTDAQSEIQIAKTGGLIRLDGELVSGGDTANGSITINDEDNGSITIILEAEAAAELEASRSLFDVKMKTASDVQRLDRGIAVVRQDVTRAIE